MSFHLMTLVEGASLIGISKRVEMKVKTSVKKMCEKCKIIKRRGKVVVICKNPRHKQRQG